MDLSSAYLVFVTPNKFRCLSDNNTDTNNKYLHEWSLDQLCNSCLWSWYRHLWFSFMRLFYSSFWFQLPVQPLTDSNPVQTGRASKDGRLMRTLLIAPHLFAPYWSPHTHSSISCSSITLLRHSSNSVRPLGDKTWHQCWPRFTPWPGVSYPERPVVLTTELKREQCNRTVDSCPAVASLRTFCLKPGAKWKLIKPRNKLQYLDFVVMWHEHHWLSFKS